MMSSRIRELFNRAVDISGAVGVQMSIIKDDEQLDFFHGVANAELGIPMTQDTVIQIGSVTKVFNAALIMSLVEEGRLDLDVPVKRYIPEFAVSDPEATRAITLRHLLSMSAGIDNGDYGDYGVADDAVAKRVAALKDLPQHFTPGAYFGYSNAGIDISGYVAERVTGRVWDDLLKERVLEPAGLKNAASLDRDRMFQRVSVGHVLDPESGKLQVIRPWAGMSRGLAPAGSTLTVSAHDLARFGKLFINKGVADSGGRVLSERSIKTMLEPQINVPVHHTATSWCLGPSMRTWDQIAIWGHAGGNTSGGSFVYWVPEKNGVMACTYNTRSPQVYPRLMKAMTQQIMKATFGVSNPGIQTPVLPVKIDPQRYTGIYESLGGHCVVDAVDDKLVMTTKLEFRIKFADTISLIPLGEDRFLIDKGAHTDPAVLPEDVAFFGDDGQGRTSNLIRDVFPFSRR